jgi:hypothetical protein
VAEVLEVYLRGKYEEKDIRLASLPFSGFYSSLSKTYCSKHTHRNSYNFPFFVFAASLKILNI